MIRTKEGEISASRYETSSRPVGSRSRTAVSSAMRPTMRASASDGTNPRERVGCIRGSVDDSSDRAAHGRRDAYEVCASSSTAIALSISSSVWARSSAS